MLHPLTRKINWVVICCEAAILSSCGPAAGTQPTSSTQPELNPASPAPVIESAASPTSDPFAYCHEAGTIDAPDTNYTGAPLPEVLLQVMIQKGIISADMPKEMQQNAIWRCMDQQVWACHFGANIPCDQKADPSQTPTAAMEDYCKNNAHADVIPAYVTGRTTIYEWVCRDSQPNIDRTLSTVDAQGYIAQYWYELEAP